MKTCEPPQGECLLVLCESVQKCVCVCVLSTANFGASEEKAKRQTRAVCS